MPPPHPRWYNKYSRDTSVAWLTFVITQHAVSQKLAADEARAIIRAEQQRELFLFEDVESGSGVKDSANVSDDSSVDSDASLTVHLNRAASCVFQTPKLRPKQEEAITKILIDPDSKGRVFVGDRTGGGKSLTLFTTAITVAGLSVFIIPLLSLTANQLSRLRLALQMWGTVEAHCVDDVSKKDMKNKIIPRMDEIDYSSSSTMAILCSPQELAHNKAFRDALFRALERQTLRMIAIDEAHLYAMHGKSFREDIRILRDVFLAPIYKDKDEGQYTPLFYAMTATMPDTLIEALVELTYVNWGGSNHQLWATPAEFAQRYIDMDFELTGTIGSSDMGIPAIIRLMKEGKNNEHVCFFENFRSECMTWAIEIESQLADELLDVDVPNMDKNEKFSFI